jgi:hypothetical protein
VASTVPAGPRASATISEPDLARSPASGPPVEPLTNRPKSEPRPPVTPGIRRAPAIAADITLIARDAGPNQPR